MNKLLIFCFATLMSCTSTIAQKSDDMQNKGEIIMSESQGGAEQAGFVIIKDEQEFQNVIKSKQGTSLVELGSEPVVKYPAFPVNKKVVLYNIGSFRAGDHTVREIKNISVKDNVLYVEVPMRESGGMQIQVLSNPWFIFSVPSNYQFTSVQLKSSN
ncbi:hypothetical protein [Chryseobacterium indoltheticum]|uniref:Uncharacterized protein n=1 Tax=Chryseobacterium indoltheticum TaxID=254 RepID=A0A381JSS2_9FLAO|nr:hypothetical protein [Chryseobacterium indoltheticum]AZA75335.1 hypothetical protein EG358_16955 [Chryseobacterium indoltheticum]SIQ71058.1 hypothetical protein SAMN05421682_107211 [Chryseobacterium indoltheticum]SUY53980.1 Uncharacterised protein [Chryseobacterium indoltheticum]